MVHSPLWKRLAVTGACALLIAISLVLTKPAHTALAQSSTVSINPPQGSAGIQVTGTGTNWASGDQMQVSWADDGSILANTTVQSNGTFTVSFKIPSSTGQGGHNIYFTDLNSRYFLTAVFTVTANTPTVIVQKVFTADSNNNPTITFSPGEVIHYMVEAQNTSSTAVTATVTYHVTGPQSIYDWSGSASLASGPLRFYSAPTILTTAPAGTYTITVTITYSGVSSSGQSQFAVISVRGLHIPSTGQIFNLFLDTTSDETWFPKYYDKNNVLQTRPSRGTHSGVDISNNVVDCQTSSPVYAAASGTVIWAGWAGAGFGWSVVVKHGYGLSNNGHYMYTLYGHMGTVGTTNQTSKGCLQVQVGNSVTTTTILGYQGSSGLPKKVTHVHFMIFAGNQDVTALSSPYDFVNKYSTYPASPDLYTCMQLTLGDPSPLRSVTQGQNGC